jgi:hypothetical protein
MALLTDRWSQTLTALQRTAWNLYGSNVVMTNKLGESINLSGFNHYIRSNSIIVHLGGTIVDNGPVVFEIPASDPTFAITASEATQIVDVTYNDALDWADETGAYLSIYQGSPQNPQRNFFGGPWRFANKASGVTAAPPAPPYQFDAVWAFSELQRFWCYARIVRADGRLSAPFRADCFAGA